MRLQKDFDPIVCVLVPYERIEEATNAHDMSQTTFLLLLPESHSVILGHKKAYFDLRKNELCFTDFYTTKLLFHHNLKERKREKKKNYVDLSNHLKKRIKLN